ncbi:MAG: Crp/Fnr family transcriptional regulator [Caulobacteraceae bacterium]
MTRQVEESALAAMALFEGVGATTLLAAAERARTRLWRRAAVVFNQGDEGVRAHIVMRGAIRIVQSGSDGALAMMRLVGPGEIFGAVALFTDGRYPADAIAMTETCEASWSEADLAALMHADPEVAINLLRIVGARLQEAQNRMRELGTQSAARRLAHTLVRLTRQADGQGGEVTSIAFPLRRTDIAELSGTTLYTASRLLSKWQRAGWLASRRQRLRLLDIEAIKAVADGDR